MNEVKKIHLGRQQFTISVDAQRTLRTYLDAIAHQVGNQAEVLKEVESRMAELLTERGITDEKVILSEDVGFLKEQLGKPRDFTDGEVKADAESSKEDESISRRLFRDTDNAMIAGVAAGLGAYLKLPPLLIRLAFIGLSFVGASGILIYVFLWLLVPEARTSSERLQMLGKAVTIDSLKEVVNRADLSGAADRLSRTLGAILQTVGKAVLAVLGIAFLVASVGLTAGWFMVGTSMFVHDGKLFTEVVRFPEGGKETALVVMVLGILLIISVMLLLASIAMIRRKWTVPAWVMATMVSLVVAAASISTALGIAVAPDVQNRYNAAFVTEERKLEPFSGIVVNGPGLGVREQYAPGFSVSLRYLKDVRSADTIKTDVRDGVLYIESTTGKYHVNCKWSCLIKDRPVEVVISTPHTEWTNPPR